MSEKSPIIRGASAAEVADALSFAELLRLADALGRERWRVVSDVAQVVATYLVCHPRVEAVRYPGLRSDPDFARAACELVGGFGPRVAFRLAGEGGWALWEAAGSGELDARAQVLELEALLGR